MLFYVINIKIVLDVHLRVLLEFPCSYKVAIFT